MSIAVCTLGCSRKRDAIHSWDTLAQLSGDYELYINWELQGTYFTESDDLSLLDEVYSKLVDFRNIYIDTWKWHTSFGTQPWRKKPAFDQDQARLASIVTARNMCIEFAIQRAHSHLLFIDADIKPPLDIIPKMLEVAGAGEDAVCGFVNGRGVHASCSYVFGSKGMETIAGTQCQRVEHANIGFTMLSARLFNQIRFRYGVTEYPDGRGTYSISDDPAFHLDAFIKFRKWPVIRMDVVGQHIGDLKANEVSQF